LDSRSPSWAFSLLQRAVKASLAAAWAFLANPSRPHRKLIAQLLCGLATDELDQQLSGLVDSAVGIARHPPIAGQQVVRYQNLGATPFRSQCGIAHWCTG